MNTLFGSVLNKLNLCHDSLLSQAGSVVLINYILNVVPLHSLSVTQMLNTVLNSIVWSTRNFV